MAVAETKAPEWVELISVRGGVTRIKIDEIERIWVDGVFVKCLQRKGFISQVRYETPQKAKLAKQAVDYLRGDV